MSLPLRCGASMAETQTLGDGATARFFEFTRFIGLLLTPLLLDNSDAFNILPVLITLVLKLLSLDVVTLLSPVVATEEKLPSCGHLAYGILSVSLLCRGEGNVNLVTQWAGRC